VVTAAQVVVIIELDRQLMGLELLGKVTMVGLALLAAAALVE
jgi:hypothetical protein